ncbi:peptidoglycan DD-metalloendopeptidase family protein [Marinobacterium maritimum]|uniref:Peptidoglycan DD-metalloendopeptidase family protein n=2 Tax=Marinobacterium maritimum TaxID=500162 RepID=A0ABP3THB2_9GAMM
MDIPEVQAELTDSASPQPQPVAPTPPPQPVPARVENWVEYPVKSGDNLTTLFKRAGLGPREVYRISQAVSGSDALKRLRPGQTLAFLIEDGLLRKLRHAQDQLNTTLIELTDTGYQVQQLERTPEARTAYAEGNINRSLFLDAAEAGLSNKTIMQLAEIFGWDIDFALDIRDGDHFRVLYEQDYLDDEPLDQSRILAAEFINQGKTFSAVRFTDSEGNSQYFAPDGRSMRKAFLRSPVDFSRISSRFKPERYHPVLGKKRPHRGVDYAAATGTPIKAAGDGKIIWRGTKGGYGRTIILQHGGNITTLYAHMSRYQKGLSNGSRVKQGQVIGYVGASGLATGPHLHYEFRSNGVHRNPLTVALPAAKPVADKERAAFKTESERLLAALNQHASQQLALSDPERAQ